jgi:DNA-binding MarR family transcriptional regulator
MGTSDAATNIVLELARSPDGEQFDGEDLTTRLQLPPATVCAAVRILENGGLVKTYRTGGGHPYDFAAAWLTPEGRVHAESLHEDELDDLPTPAPIGFKP